MRTHFGLSHGRLASIFNHPVTPSRSGFACVAARGDFSVELSVALAGNPNVGKTTLFNALTGLRQKVANYPGVTVEKKMGRCVLKAHTPKGRTLSEDSDAGDARGSECWIIDLPGTYSLASRSPDEHVARQVVLGQIAGTPRPDVIVVVCDASNLERNLYLVTQVLELGRPVVVALSMVDVAQQQGKRVDAEKLSRHLRAPVVPVQAHKTEKNGIVELKAAIARAGKHENARSPRARGRQFTGIDAAPICRCRTSWKRTWSG